MSSTHPADTAKVVVFGYSDALAGQVVHMLGDHGGYAVDCFIAVHPLPPLDIEKAHAERPNRKTEFAHNGSIFGRPLFEGMDFVATLRERNVSKCFVLEDDRYLRSEIFALAANAGLEICSFVHPSTYIGGENAIGTGVIVFPNCYLGYKADIRDGVIMQANCSIEHHNVVGNFVNINPNLSTGGFTELKDFVEVNISVDIVNRVTIGENARIGAGSLVLDDCAPGGLYFGRPARFVRAV